MSKVKIVGRAKQKESYDPTEYQIHKAFVDYVKKTHPHIAKLLIHIPNEGKRTSQGHKAQELLGMMPGCADLFIALPGFNTAKMLHESGLWLEFKSNKGKVSRKQQDFLMTMEQEGYATGIAYSIDEAIKIFEDYIK